MCYKKIQTILNLISNFIIRGTKYKLKFVKEGDSWFYDFKNWGFDHSDLEMVSGADKLCELYSKGTREVIVEIIASKKKKPGLLEEYDEWEGEDLGGFDYRDRLIWGRTYKNGKGEKFWICPVTLFVLGRYPNYIYIKKNNGK